MERKAVGKGRLRGGRRGGARLAGALQLQQQAGLARKQELAEGKLLQAAALQHAAPRRAPRRRQQRGRIVPGAAPACAAALASLASCTSGVLTCLLARVWQSCR